MIVAERPEDGSASVLMLSAAGVVAAAVTVALLAAAAVTARHRAGGAADLAALAAAQVVEAGPRVACAAAGRVAAANGARLDRCRVTGPVVEVRVRLTLGGPLRRWAAAAGRASAGPARCGDHLGVTSMCALR